MPGQTRINFNQPVAGILPLLPRLSLVSPDHLKELIKTNLSRDTFQRTLPPKSGLPLPTNLFKGMTGGREFLTVDGLPVTIEWDRQHQGNPKSHRIPEGYGTIKGNLPKGLSQVASHILKKGNPLGTYTPFTLNGKAYVALNEYHTHYASRPHDPPGKIYAITVFRKL